MARFDIDMTIRIKATVDGEDAESVATVIGDHIGTMLVSMGASPEGSTEEGRAEIRGTVEPARILNVPSQGSQPN